MSVEDILEKVRTENPMTRELHITGGVDPTRNLYYYAELIRKIKKTRPDLHIKAFSAVELDYMFEGAGMDLHEGLTFLKDAGLDSIPGGGAEIFDETLRKELCPDKTTSVRWLSIHEAAHRLGIPSNATMLYGHTETFSHRIDHLDRLRQLQDSTGGFLAFIPLKFRHQNNEMSSLKEVSLVEDMRNYAVSRIYLDNFPHLKAYWPMLGAGMAQVALSFGVDDLDGTIQDTTQIYSMAGAEDSNPAMTAEKMEELIRNAGWEPVERWEGYKEMTNYEVRGTKL